jgi:hypothetical protein
MVPLTEQVRVLTVKLEVGKVTTILDYDDTGFDRVNSKLY